VSRELVRLPALRAAWNRFWFAPASPENLACCRLLFYGGLLYFFGTRDFSALAGVDAVFWKPIWLFRLVGLPKPSAEVLKVVQTVWRFSLAASCVGFLTRLATGVSFVFGSFLLGLLYCFGGSGHSKSIVVFAMGSLALSRCGAVLSVDRWIRARRGEPRPGPSGEYCWPIRLVWVAMTFAFFGAGVSKVRHAGLGWVTTDRLAVYLVRSNYPLVRDSNAPMNDWGLWLARHREICRALAAGTLFVELGFPLALLSRRLRPILVSSAFLMQVGITVVMGPDFDVFIWSYLFWVPWDRVKERVLGRVGDPGLSPEPVVRGSVSSPP